MYSANIVFILNSTRLTRVVVNKNLSVQLIKITLTQRHVFYFCPKFYNLIILSLHILNIFKI